MDKNIDATLELLLSGAPSIAATKEFKVKRLSKEFGADVVFVLQALTFNRVVEIREIESEEQNIHIVLAGVVSPDLRDSRLLAKYKSDTPAEMLKALLLPGEIDELARKIEQVSGYRTEMLEELKKK